MANLKIVSRDEFAGLHWRPVTSYQFTAKDSFCQLVLQELATACLHTPLALFKRDDHYVPVSIQALLPMTNLLIGANGAWNSAYIPSPYRAYPFLLMKGADNANLLAVDMESGLVDAQPNGLPFFEEGGEPAERVREVMNFLSHVQANRERTRKACELLAEYALIEPWPILLPGNNEERRIEGYYRIEEGRFNALPADRLAALRDAGALPLIFAQLISMQHLPLFIKLTLAREARAQTQAPPPSFGDSHGILSFEGL
jgi:hypothetical protein